MKTRSETNGQETATVSQLLHRLNNWIITSIEQFSDSKYWWLKLFFIAVCFSILFSGGFDFGLNDPTRYPDGYYKKIEHPFFDVAKVSGLNSHESALNFRLTVPVLLYLLGVHSHWSLPILTILAICTILLVSCLLAYRITGDRVCACFITMNVSATYIGSFGLIFCYDAIAIVQLAAACLPSLAWWARGLLVFTASFTDERAFVASGILLIWFFVFGGSRQGILAKLRNPDFLAAGAGMIAYGLGRLALMKFAGISSPTQGCGPGELFKNLSFLHPAVWFALEGGWLFYLLAVGILFAHRQRLGAMAIIAGSLASLGFAFMIGDLLRSVVYIFPLLFMCIQIVRQNESLQVFRTYCLFAFLISALGGNYNVFLGRITWFEPLLIHWFQTGFGVFYDWIYPYLPHTMPRGSH